MGDDTSVITEGAGVVVAASGSAGADFLTFRSAMMPISCLFGVGNLLFELPNIGMTFRIV